MTKNVQFVFSIGDTTRAIHNEYWASQNKIGDTEYNIQCSFCDKVA